MRSKEKRGVSVCESRNGEYCFLEKSDKIPEELKNYSYIDLSACQCIEEMAAAIIDEELKELVLLGTKEVYNLLKVLVRKMNQVDEHVMVTIQICECKSKENRKDTGTSREEAALHAFLTGNYPKTENYETLSELYGTKKWLLFTG